MDMSLQALKTLNFNKPGFHDGVATTVFTEAADLTGFQGDAYIIVCIGNTGNEIAIDSVVLQDNFSTDPGDDAEWAAVTDGTFSRFDVADVYNFLGTVVIPIDKLRRYIRVFVTTTGTGTTVASIAATGVVMPQYKNDNVKYMVAEA